MRQFRDKTPVKMANPPTFAGRRTAIHSIKHANVIRMQNNFGFSRNRTEIAFAKPIQAAQTPAAFRPAISLLQAMGKTEFRKIKKLLKPPEAE